MNFAGSRLDAKLDARNLICCNKINDLLGFMGGSMLRAISQAVVPTPILLAYFRCFGAPRFLLCMGLFSIFLEAPPPDTLHVR